VAGGAVAFEHRLPVHFGRGNAGGALRFGQRGHRRGKVDAEAKGLTAFVGDHQDGLEQRANFVAEVDAQFISPVAPARISQGTGGISTMVQPHEGRAFKMVTAFVNWLVNTNVKCATGCPLVAATVLTRASQARMPAGIGAMTREIFSPGLVPGGNGLVGCANRPFSPAKINIMAIAK